MAKQAKQVNSEPMEKDKSTAHHTIEGTAVRVAPPKAEYDGDGFDTPDEGSGDSLLAGTEKLKFTKAATWVDRDDEVIDPERRFIVAGIKKATQKWLPDADRPETHVLGPEEYFPDIEKMNAEAPQSEWRTAFGKRQGPYEAVYAVRLFDPKTMAAFTFITATRGGHRAVEALKGKVNRARMLKGPNLFALVTLGDSIMKSKQFGEVPAPDFKVLDFIALGGSTHPLLQEQKKPALLEQSNKPSTDKNADLDDDITF